MNRRVATVITFLLLILTTLNPVIFASDTLDYVDSNTIDKDGSPDVGTETNFVNCQDLSPDADYMNIQESDTGSAGVNEDLDVNAVTSDYTTWGTSGNSPWLDADEGSNIVTGNANGQQRGWFGYADTSETGSGFTVVLYVDFDAGDGDDDCNWNIDTTGDNTAEFSGTFTNPTTATMNTGTISGFDTATEINNARLRIDYIKRGGGGIMTVDYSYLNIQRAGSTNYTIDFEYNWTGLDYDETDEEVCIYYAEAVDLEDLNVSYWNTTGTNHWTHLGFITGTTGWKNFTLDGLDSQYYTIRINGTSETSDTTQDDFDIDVMLIHTWTSNNAPTQSNPGPSNGAIDIPLLPTLNVTVDDLDDDTLTAYWRSNSTGVWATFNTNTSIDTSSGPVNISQVNLNFTNGSTKYWWSINLTDGSLWFNATYYFTTIDYIWINITNTSWSVGTVVMGSSKWTNGTSETIICDMDNTSVNSDLKLQITTDGLVWTSATSGNPPSADIYRLNASIDTWSTENQIITASQTTISSNIPAWTNETFDFRFDAPTSSTTGNQQTITITASLIKN